MPGDVAGFTFSRFDHDTGLSADDLEGLPANVRDRLAEGIRVDSVEDADALVETWKEQIEEYKKDTAPASEKLTDGKTDSSDASSARSADADESDRAADSDAEAGDAA